MSRENLACIRSKGAKLRISVLPKGDVGETGRKLVLEAGVCAGMKMAAVAGLTVATHLLVKKQCFAEHEGPIFVLNDSGQIW
ncbi:MAG TPA: hypothetical protein VLZ10_10355 [Thermodesulfobacteriota bacterium]|nr:hypothetical protein [Thermodesulfobacteriota bacterium]